MPNPSFLGVSLLDLDLIGGAMPPLDVWTMWEGGLGEFEDYPKKKLCRALGIDFSEYDARDVARAMQIDQMILSRLGDIVRMDTEWQDRLAVFLAENPHPDIDCTIGHYGYMVMCVISSIMLNGQSPNSRYDSPHWAWGDWYGMGDDGKMRRSRDFELHQKILSRMEAATFYCLVDEGTAAKYVGHLEAYRNRVVYVDRIYMNRNTAVVSVRTGYFTCTLRDLRPVHVTCNGVVGSAPCVLHTNMVDH